MHMIHQKTNCASSRYQKNVFSFNMYPFKFNCSVFSMSRYNQKYEKKLIQCKKIAVKYFIGSLQNSTAYPFYGCMYYIRKDSDATYWEG